MCVLADTPTLKIVLRIRIGLREIEEFNLGGMLIVSFIWCGCAGLVSKAHIWLGG